MRNLLLITLFLISFINVSVADEGKVWFCETKNNISMQRDFGTGTEDIDKNLKLTIINIKI